MGKDLKTLEIEEGYLVVDTGSGPPRQLPVADLLRGVDMPEMDPDEVVDMAPVISKLAQVVVILVKTLIEADVIGEEYADDWDIQYFEEVLVDDLEAEWGE